MSYINLFVFCFFFLITFFSHKAYGPAPYVLFLYATLGLGLKIGSQDHITGGLEIEYFNSDSKDF